MCCNTMNIAQKMDHAYKKTLNMILWRVQQFLPLPLICQQTSIHSPTAMGDHL